MFSHRQTSTTSRTQRGFTLVELLAAILLTTLLTTSLMGVIRAMNQQRKLTMGEHPLEGWKLQLRQRLLSDLSNTRRLGVTDGRLTLLGYASRDAEAGVATHRPCEVVYRLESLAGRTWLIREESPLGTQSPTRANSELAAYGITSIRVTRMEDDGTEADIVLNQAQRGDLMAIPSRLRCSLLAENGTPVIEAVFFQPRTRR